MLRCQSIWQNLLNMMFIIKALIVLVSLPLVLVNLVLGLTKNDKLKLKRAGVIFFSAFVILLLMSAAEFGRYSK